MSSVKAIGIMDGHEVNIEVKKINGKWIASIPFMQGNIDHLLNEGRSIAGTYYPEKQSLTAVYNIMENYFFDKLISIECEGELEKLPFQEDVIY